MGSNFNIIFKHNSILTRFALFAIILSINLQCTLQNNSIDQFATVEATCVYNLDSRSHYTCTIKNTTVLNPTDVLTIVGTHLPGYTDINVQRVSHDAISIRYFNGEVFRKFSNIKNFDLFNQGLREISATAFEVCPNLEEILIGFHNQHTALPPQMMKNCGKLKSFIAIYNNFTEISMNFFGLTTNLEQFYVFNNHLTSLPEDLLQNMRNLTKFDVSSNFLTELSPNLLKNCPNLEQVFVGLNSFVDQYAVTNALNGFINLRILNIAGNNFTNFDFTFFEQFQKLERLAAGSTNGPQLTGITWQSLPSSLVELSIEGIGEELPENAFDKLVNLISLSLTGSGIENLQKNTFKPLSNLLELYIDNTNIKVLHPEIFINQINLRTINLSDNKIEELPAGIFTPLVNLGIGSTFQGIRMDRNNLKRLNANSFGQHPHVQFISFNQNKINEIERGIFSKFHQNLTTASFWSNVCIDRSFRYSSNLDQNENLLWCFNNWAGITTTTTSTTTTKQPSPTTTPGECGNSFRKLEIFGIILIGFVGFFMNFCMQ
ncbi:hypothetical protein ACKWTF_015888 [Chironomus riparius]